MICPVLTVVYEREGANAKVLTRFRAGVPEGHTVSMAIVLDTEQLTNVTMGDQELMRELMCALVDDTAQHVDLIRMAVSSGDAKGCARLAHSAKGACANLGARAMAEALRALERDAVEDDLSGCDRRIPELSAGLVALRDCVNGL